MKTAFTTLAISLAGMSAGLGQSSGYTNFIRQVLLGSTPAIYWDVSVESKGERLSPVALDLAGARYELWTVKSGSSPKSYLLDTAYVSSFAPEADIVINTLDPDGGSVPRTRADQPFSVDVQVKGLLSGANVPEAAKSVRLLHHVQSYGDTYGENIDRTQATLFAQSLIEKNGKTKLDYSMTNVPGTDLTKIRGEERFSVYTRKDDGTLDEQLCSRYVVVWPLTTVTIAGLDASETIRFKAPEVTIDVADMYPKSYTYTQVYPGDPVLGTEGTKITSAQRQIDQQQPLSKTWRIENLGDYLTKDGTWTIEVITETVYGRERLAYTTFEVDRGLEVRSLLSTLE
ncbi:hypothetical protein [Haloferula sargassicola]|uniref:Uncharacterized protein n=1 Tax=Haloferula sargassicola TaxID=490096 RepID=A0ABP9USM6_9BACT